jgi:hypothetical protein
MSQGETGDDLVPLIDSYDFLSEGDKLAAFDTNTARVVPAFAKMGE